MGSDGFCFAGSLQHEQLRQYGDTFEPQGEGPQDLGNGPFVREHDGQDGGSTQEVRYTESIEVRIMRRLVVVQHDVQCISGRAEKDDFEQGIPSTVGKSPENI